MIIRISDWASLTYLQTLANILVIRFSVAAN